MIPPDLIHRLADLGIEALTAPLDESESTRRLFLEIDDLWSRFLEARQLEVKRCPHALLEPSVKGQRCASCHWPVGAPLKIVNADPGVLKLSLPETAEVETIVPKVCAECGLAPLPEAPGLSFQPGLERWVCFDCGHRG